MAQNKWKCAACRELHRSEVAGVALRRGLQALENSHRGLVEGAADCSLEFDSVFKSTHGHTNRFDYLFVRGRDCEVIAVEVHPASSTGNVDDLIQKKKGTEQILAKEGVNVRIKNWHWVASGGVVFSAMDKYGLRLSKEGIRQPRKTAKLDD